MPDSLPPLSIDPQEPAAAFDPVLEVGAGPGTLLGRLVRSVRLWAHTPPGARAALFAGGADASPQGLTGDLELDPALAAPVGQLAAVVLRPGEAADREVGIACLAVADWARAAGARSTATLFAETAALVFARPTGTKTRRSTSPSTRSRTGWSPSPPDPGDKRRPRRYPPGTFFGSGR
jgi:hypothetical protein